MKNHFNHFARWIALLMVLMALAAGCGQEGNIAGGTPGETAAGGSSQEGASVNAGQEGADLGGGQEEAAVDGGQDGSVDGGTAQADDGKAAPDAASVSAGQEGADADASPDEVSVGSSQEGASVNVGQEGAGISGGQEGASVDGGQDGLADGGAAQADDSKAEPDDVLPKDGSYTTAEDVSRYLILYGQLPQNFITKKEAKELGWPGGSLEPYAPGKCIGGDRFGNYEGLLPEEREYHECDIDTLGAQSRGAKRLVYSDDGLIYYTEDHYESFILLCGEE